MICDESLAVTECRSLHGLVCFVTTLFPAVTTSDATRYLLIDNARQSHLEGNARRPPPIHFSSRCLQLRCSCGMPPRPYCTALVALATMILPGEEEKMKSLLEAKHVLTADDIQTISTTLQYDLPSKSLVV